MRPLFSLNRSIRDDLIPIDQAPSSIRSSLLGGEIPPIHENNTKVISVDADMTLNQVYTCVKKELSTLTQDTIPIIVALNNQNHPVGFLTLPDVLALFASVVNNQSDLLHTLLDTMSEATTVVDYSNTVLYWNDAAEKIYELPREEVVGTLLDNHFASESIRLNIALAEGTSVRRLYHVPRPDRHVLINSAPIRSGRDESIIGALSIEQDITELVRLYQELTDTTAHLHTLQQEMSRYQATDDPFYAIKGHSSSIQFAIQSAKKVAQTDATVLIYGESGVGKELFAQAIHKASRRADHAFIAINCAAIPAALFESELFGYQGGAFTGAEKKGKPGKLEMANDGTLFLDEIGELPVELQAKLLRALQERQFYRVGGIEPIKVNTRIITATNRQLEQMVAEGRFREDLYYRLNVFSLEVPPLRERAEDIPELVQIFLQEYSIANDQPLPRLTPEVMQELLDYHWPGNIRQLRNVMERLSILQDGGIVQLEHLPQSIRSGSQGTASSQTNQGAAEQTREVTSVKLRRTTITASPINQPRWGAHDSTEYEKSQITDALHRTYGNKKAAATLLGISRGTLYNKMRKYGIEPDHTEK